jgi:hypothetical protein
MNTLQQPLMSDMDALSKTVHDQKVKGHIQSLLHQLFDQAQKEEQG